MMMILFVLEFFFCRSISKQLVRWGWRDALDSGALAARGAGGDGFGARGAEEWERAAPAWEGVTRDRLASRQRKDDTGSERERRRSGSAARSTRGDDGRVRRPSSAAELGRRDLLQSSTAETLVWFGATRSRGRRRLRGGNELWAEIARAPRQPVRAPTGPADLPWDGRWRRSEPVPGQPRTRKPLSGQSWAPPGPAAGQVSGGKRRWSVTVCSTAPH